MSSLVAVLVYWLYCLCFSEATRYPQIHYLDDSCGNLTLVSGDAIIKISKRVFLKQGNCSLTLVPSRPIQLVAYVLTYSMNGDYVSDKDCPYEFIQLGSPVNCSLLGPSGYCKSTRPDGQYFLSNQGTYSYTSDGRYNYSPDVELLVTEIERENAQGYCPAGYFECDWRDICIDQSLKCNGYDDCGNGRDEEDCSSSSGLSGGAIAGIIVGILGLFVIIIVVFWSLLKDKIQYDNL